MILIFGQEIWLRTHKACENYSLLIDSSVKTFDIEKVPNLEACKRAAGYSLGVSLYGYKYFEYTVYAADRPKGCYVNGQNIYWNNHPTGGKSSGIRSVCQRGMCYIKAHQL